MLDAPLSPYSADETLRLKDAYARELATGADARDAAIAVLEKFSYLAANWAGDEYVIQRKNIHRADIEFAANNVLGKETYLLEVQRQMLDPRAPHDFRFHMFQLFARTSGFIEGRAGSINQVVNNGLLIMSDCGTDEQWEAESRAQQQKLIASVKN